MLEMYSFRFIRSCISWTQYTMGILFICSYIHVSWIFGSECIWAATWQNQQNGCAPSEDSDQRSPPPTSPRSQRHLEISNKMESFPSYGSRIFVSLFLRPYYFLVPLLSHMPYANNKDADQPVHPRSLISTFIVRCLDSMIYLVSILAISWL